MFRITTAILAFYITTVQCDDDKVQQIAPGSMPLQHACVVVQKVTPAYEWPSSLYWCESKQTLIFPDRKCDVIYCWNLNDGSVSQDYNASLSGQDLAFVIPIKNQENKYIAATDMSLRVVTQNNKEISVSEPQLKFEHGSKISASNCDKNGRLLVLISETNKDVLLYIVENKKPILYLNHSVTCSGFTLNYENTKGYGCDNGNTIYQYDYDLKLGALTNQTLVFDIRITPYMNYEMTAITMDRSGHLWVAGSCKKGMIFKINPNNGKIEQMVIMPVTQMNSIHFGGENYTHLFVTSDKTCAQCIGQGSIFAVSGLGVVGIPSLPVAW